MGLVLKGIFSETAYVCVLTYQISSSSITLTSSRRGNPPPPHSKQTPQYKPTQIRVKNNCVPKERLT